MTNAPGLARPGTVLHLFENSSSRLHLPDGATVAASDIAVAGRVIAAKWRALGRRPGDRVAVRLPNGLAYLHALAACSAARCVLVSVNTRYSAIEAEDLIARSGASMVIDEASHASLVDATDGALADPDLEAAAPEDPFLVFTTSGTTSRPKMVVHSQRSVSRHGRDAAGGLGYTDRDVSLVVMPFCGTFGLASLLASLAADATVIVADVFDVERTGRVIAERGVTVVNGSDDMFHRLLLAGADLRTIRLAGYARFNSSLDWIVARAEAAGATLAGLYGMSEVQALFAGREPSLDTEARSRAGGTLVSNDASYRIVDGELWLRGPSLFTGYLAEGGAEVDPELTGRAHSDGWFRTGDAAEADGDRAFTYVTRLGDTLRLGGFLVAPADIEQTLLQVQGIEEAQVVAVDRPTGARPVAFVIAPGGFDEGAAIEHCASRLARYKVPVRVVALSEFPTTQSANGTKIQNVKLREMAAALLEEPARNG